MNVTQGLLLSIVAIVFMLFIWDRWRFDVVSLVALLTLHDYSDSFLRLKPFQALDIRLR